MEAARDGKDEKMIFILKVDEETIIRIDDERSGRKDENTKCYTLQDWQISVNLSFYFSQASLKY